MDGLAQQASFELPVELIQDNDEARIEVHRKPLGRCGFHNTLELASVNCHMACDSSDSSRQYSSDQTV